MGVMRSVVSFMVGPQVIIDGQKVPDRTLTVITVGNQVTPDKTVRRRKHRTQTCAIHRDHTHHIHNVHLTAQVTQFRFWSMEKLQKLLLIPAVHKHWFIKV